jgi:glycosyltransferase involved in cell wall biosynthesis
MKIIQVSPRFYPDIGGIETHVREISKRIAKKHEVIVYTTTSDKKFKKEEIIDGIKVRRFRSLGPKKAYFFSPKLYFSLKKEEGDILHLHNFHSLPAYLGYLAFRKKKLKRMIFTPHYHPMASTSFRDFLHRIYDPIQSVILEKSHKILCVSDYEIDLLNERFSVPKSKMKKIPNGIDLKRFAKKESKKDPKKFNILCVSRLEKYKRVQWIISSLVKLIEKYPEKQIILKIIGKGSYEKSLRKNVERNDLQDKVIFKCDLPEKEFLDEFQNCDVFVLASKYEAFSIVTLEALCFGKPVVVSNVGFLKELAKNNGYTIESEDDVAKAISKIIENGFEVKFDCRDYSWDRIANEVLEVYDN